MRCFFRAFRWTWLIRRKGCLCYPNHIFIQKMGAISSIGTQRQHIINIEYKMYTQYYIKKLKNTGIKRRLYMSLSYESLVVLKVYLIQLSNVR